MNYVNSIFRSINFWLGHVAQNMDAASWAAVAVVTVVLGMFLLRGNVIRST